MTKEKLGNELMYNRIGYKQDRWKWVLSLPYNTSKNKFEFLNTSQITRDHLLKCYGLDKYPKNLPCLKRCNQNPWCLGGLKVGGASSGRVPLTNQPRDGDDPVGLQNTANTCWINSALQLFYNMRKFRNAINSTSDFQGDESLDTFRHLLQVIFAQMQTHPHKAIACEPGSVFEQLGMFSSREIMKKDANNELLKCVSEFMENTIDWLAAEPSLAATLAPMFTISLTRLARWVCSTCGTVHQYELSPASCYTMGAYISADQAPLQQCLMDLQAETQTGVLMVCGGSAVGGGGGCGASAKVDRVVTPVMSSLPNYLIIRNNSLIAEDVKRRLHVVYPELLDLSAHTLNGREAHYALTGVVYHHGQWVKHYSAQVQTEGGQWYSFNDETVMEMTGKTTSATSQANPQENHPNYFSLASVSAKYARRSGERVSRGAFIWLYSLMDDRPDPLPVLPHPTVMTYIATRGTGSEDDNKEQLKRVQVERQILLKEIAVVDESAPYSLISEALLHAWLGSQDCHFVAQPPLDIWCQHGNLKPTVAHTMKCIRRDKVNKLLSAPCGIHTTSEALTAPPAPPSVLPAAELSSRDQTDSLKCDDSKRIKLDSVTSSGEQLCTTTTTTTSELLYKDVKCSPAKVRHSSIDSLCTSSSDNNCHSSLSAASNCFVDLCRIENNELVQIESVISKIKSEVSPVIVGCPSNVSNSCNKIKTNGTSHCDSSSEGNLISNSNNSSRSTSNNSTSINTINSNNGFHNAETSSNFTSDKNEIASSYSAIANNNGSAPNVGSSHEGFVCNSGQWCRECLALHARHILYLEHLKMVHKQAKKQALKQREHPTSRVVGIHTLELWPKVAARRYARRHNIDLSTGGGDSSASDDASVKQATTDIGSGDTVSTSTSAADEGVMSSSCSSSQEATTSSSTSNNKQEDDDKVVTEDEPTGYQYLNEDLVCSHFQLNPQANMFYIPEDTFNQLVELCGEDIHPATVLDDFQTCVDCQSVLSASETACARGQEEKRVLPALFAEKRRPSHTRDTGSLAYLLDRDTYDGWKAFVRSCMRGMEEARPAFSNEDLLCKHGALHYNPALLETSRHSQLWVLVWPEEWAILVGLYGPPIGKEIKGIVTVTSLTSMNPDICSRGCVEAMAELDYEDQFDYRNDTIYVRQVHSPADIPVKATPANTRSMGPTTSTTPFKQPLPTAGSSVTSEPGSGSSTTPPPVMDASTVGGNSGDETLGKRAFKDDVQETQQELPSKVARLANGSNDGTPTPSPFTPPTTPPPSARQSGRRRVATVRGVPCATPATVTPRGGGRVSTNASLGQKLVRASNSFASTDTVRQVQNFIAERTSVWPMLQTVWLNWSEDLAKVLALPATECPGPVLLSEEHLTMTLGALRVRPGDTIYFRAAKEDMELAAGDGITEYDEPI